MRIVVTGSDGFIGKNLRWHLRERDYEDVTGLDVGTGEVEAQRALAEAGRETK